MIDFKTRKKLTEKLLAAYKVEKDKLLNTPDEVYTETAMLYAKHNLLITPTEIKASGLEALNRRYRAECSTCGEEIFRFIYFGRSDKETATGLISKEQIHYCHSCRPEQDEYNGFYDEEAFEEEARKYFEWAIGSASVPREYGRWIKRLSKLKLVKSFDCPCCGRSVYGATSTKKYCSSYCREEMIKSRPKKGRVGTHLKVKECEQCGGEFTAKRSDARFCSPLCKQNARNARKRAERESLK